MIYSSIEKELQLRMEDNENYSPLLPAAEAEVKPAVVTGVSVDEKPAIQGGGDSVAAVGGGENGVAEVLGEDLGDRRKIGRPRTRDSSVFSDNPTNKRNRGRPKGTGKLQMIASLGGVALTNFTPHAVTVLAGENILHKIFSFSQRGSRCISVLTATGVVSSVELRQPGSFGDVLRYKGLFEILTLTGSQLPNYMEDVRPKFSLFTVTLAHPDGRVFGGVIAGSLIAGRPIQLILASSSPKMENKLKTKLSPESPDTTGILCNIDAATVQEPNGKTVGAEENCLKPISDHNILPDAKITATEKTSPRPTSPFPEPLFEGGIGQNDSQAFLGSADGNASDISKPISDDSSLLDGKTIDSEENSLKPYSPFLI